MAKRTEISTRAVRGAQDYLPTRQSSYTITEDDLLKMAQRGIEALTDPKYLEAWDELPPDATLLHETFDQLVGFPPQPEDAGDHARWRHFRDRVISLVRTDVQAKIARYLVAVPGVGFRLETVAGSMRYHNNKGQAEVASAIERAKGRLEEMNTGVMTQDEKITHGALRDRWTQTRRALNEVNDRYLLDVSPDRKMDSGDPRSRKE